MNGGLPLELWKGLLVERENEKKHHTERVEFISTSPPKIQKSQFKLSSFYPAQKKSERN
jgi:hypothetical protein